MSEQQSGNPTPSARQDILAGYRIVDFGTGMAPALISQQLHRCGADVTRIEPAAGDPFYERYPAYPAWHDGKDIRRGLDAAAVEHLISEAHVVIVGGEDHPALPARIDAAALSRAHPGLVVLDITGYPDCLGMDGAPASEFLSHVASGLPFEQGEGTHILGFPPSSCGAALLGLVATLAAIHEQVRTGRGALVSTSLFEGALIWGLPVWYHADEDNRHLQNGTPKDVGSLVFRCRDGRYIQIALGAAGSKGSLYRVLGIDDPSVTPQDSGFPTLRNGARNFYGDVDLLATYFVRFDSAPLLRDLIEAGVPCSFVEEPGGCWDDEQVQANGIITRDSAGRRLVDFPLEFVPAASSSPPSAAGEAKPFDQMRLLDFGTLVAGPLAALSFVDLGIQVVKVETHAGDLSRGFARGYLNNNRGKLSLSVDLKAPEGQEVCRRLLAGSDFAVSNFRTGVVERLGLDIATLARDFPHLSVLEATAFGSRGPNARLPGYDQIFQAISGIEYCTGGGGEPLCSRLNPVDQASALLGTSGLLLGLIARDRTKVAAAFRANLLNTSLFMMSSVVQQPDGRFEGAFMSNPGKTGRSAAEALYETADGWIALSIVTPEMGASLFRLLGLGSEAVPPPGEWGEAEAQRIAAAILARPTAGLLAAMSAAGIWSVAAPTGGGAILTNEHALRDGVVVELDDPRGGRFRQLGRLFRISTLDRPPGATMSSLGENTRTVLSSIGYSAQEIDDLLARGICRQASPQVS